MPSPAPEPLSPRPLTVWLVNPFDDIPGEGFAPLRSWTLARVLAARGHDVTWWTATWSHRRKAIRTAPLGIRDDEGFAVRLVAVRPYEKDASLARIGSHRDFGRTFERLANESISSGQLERPDIIVAAVPPLDGAEAAARLARRLDATFVLDVVEDCCGSCERMLPGPAFLRPLLSSLLLGGVRKRSDAVQASADAVASTTHATLEALGSSSSPSPLRHVCYVGAYPQEFASPPRAINHVPSSDGPTELPEHPPLECVYAGTLEASQDLDVLAAAARHLSAAGVKAVIHVAGTGSAEAGLRRAAASLGGSCGLKVHGLLPRQAYVNLFSQSDVGLVCVKPESLVAVPQEACDYSAAGLAMINSLPGELQRLIDDHGAGLAYTAGDATSLARAITTLASDRTRLAAYRQGARRLAAAEFDRERTYPKLADWLETVTG
jgi:glycosyltransferase involved in cell wall biosynthesis